MLKVLSKEPSAVIILPINWGVLMTFNGQTFQAKSAPGFKAGLANRPSSKSQNAVIIHDPPISFARWDHCLTPNAKSTVSGNHDYPHETTTSAKILDIDWITLSLGLVTS
jgi:hypothetical protein